jgi:hypothetical protein
MLFPFLFRFEILFIFISHSLITRNVLIANEGIILKEDSQSRAHTQRGTHILFGPNIQKFEETSESDFDQDLDSYFIISHSLKLSSLSFKKRNF